MKSLRVISGGRFLVACCAISVVTIGFTFRVASAQSNGQSKKIHAARSSSGAVPILSSGKVIIGRRLSELRDIPVLPPIVVDYRDDSLAHVADGAKPAPINYGGAKVPNRAATGSAAGPGPAGTACRFDAECNDCNPCTLDQCGTASCTGGERDGFPCDPDNNDCGGLCNGGLNDDCPDGFCDPGTLQCVGGGNPDGACTPKKCFADTDCCGDEGVGGLVPNSTCNVFACTVLTPPPGGGEQCINGTIPAGQFESGSECDDGDQCNGNETCDCNGATCAPNEIGACVAGTPFCDGTPGTFCQLSGTGAAQCAPFCVSDAECDLDEDPCSTDICDAKRCVGGFRDGQACVADVDCIEPGGGGNDGTCTGGGTGACIVGTPLCGPGGADCTPGFCIGGQNPGEACSSNTDCLAGTCGCGTGRCCLSDGTCSAVTFEDCTMAGGVWFSTADACRALGDTNTDNICPVYGSGVAPQGTLSVAIGPITSFNPFNCPGTVTRAGDDYTAGGAAAGASFISVEIVRFIASVQFTSRLSIEFWDVSVDPPIFIEDVFFIGSPGPGGPAIRTLVFDPPLAVPASGAIALTNAVDFTPLGATSFVSTESPPIVGTNDPNKMFVNGQIVTGFLGVCVGGGRDGQWCDTNGVAATCPGGTCQDVDDVLGFEIVGFPAGDPTGACCSSAGGACQEKLPWICELEGSVFQGVGSSCNVCENDLFKSCATSADCPACDVSGDACQTTADCPAGETCTAEAACLPVPPACSVQACCGNDGTCTQAVGVCTIPGVIGPIPCTSDLDCQPANGTCTNNLCPIGTTSSGFGTACDPNCCNQPTIEHCPGGTCVASVCSGGLRDGEACQQQSGGDNCLSAPTADITVPDPGSPPVVVTVTGNNSGASFDDWNVGLCDGGTSDGQFCDPNAADQTLECPGGGTCTRLCGSGIFNPNGVTQDPGHWEGFHIDDCANVRIQTCCSDPIVRPGWAFISTGCPCTTFIGNTGADDPIGTGVGGPGFARGLPFCNEDNLWQTFSNLPAGTYYYPILSDPDSQCAAPIVGGTGCEYQFSVIVGACKLAACCGSVCNGGTRSGQPCNPDGIVECPNGTCVNGTCAGGTLQGLPCTDLSVDQCPTSVGSCQSGTCVGGLNDGLPCPGGAGDCPDDVGVCDGTAGCAVSDPLTCDVAGGFWMAELNTPEAACNAGANFGVECQTDDDCPGGGPGSCVVVGNVVTCGTGRAGSTPCDQGVCCNGPGVCIDQTEAGQPMTSGDCTLLGGDFLGGTRCEYPQPPCPVCTAAEFPENCQPDSGGFFWFTDLINGGGEAVADDFISGVTEIGQFCFTPCFFGVGGVGECSNPNGPVPPPPDQIVINFYDDGGNDANPDTPPGFPGDLLPNSPGPGEVTPIAAKRWLGNRCWQYSIVFDPPIQGFFEGRRYWVSFVGTGTRDEDGNGCTLGILTSLDGNDWSMRETDSFGETRWDINDLHPFAERGGGGDVHEDWSFCVEGGITTPPDMTGACCLCDGTCTDDVPWADCLSSLAIDGSGATFVVTETQGAFHPQLTCDEVIASGECVDQGSGGGCPGQLGAAGEDCLNPLVVKREDLPPFETKTIEYSNLCSSTDGDGVFDLCGDVTNEVVGNDKWIRYEAGCQGRINVDICGGTVDAVMAIFTNGTSTCPSELGQCPPDQSTDMVYCDDGECQVQGPTTQLFGTDSCKGGARDGLECENCPGGNCASGLCVGGARDGQPCEDCPGGLCRGQCFDIELTGDARDVGTGQIELQCETTNCFPSSAIVTETITVESPPGSGSFVTQDSVKNRFLSFFVGDPNQRQAIRIIPKSLPAHMACLEGSVWWAQWPPFPVSNSGSSPTPIPAFSNFLATTLIPDSAFDPALVFADWNGVCVAGACQGGLSGGQCASGICAGGQNDGATCADDTDCAGLPCSNNAECRGVINVLSEIIVPNASYTVQVLQEDCNPGEPVSFSDEVVIDNPKWGDTLKDLVTVPALPPNGTVDIVDVLGIIGRFVSDPSSILKSRADLEPSELDLIINISDALVGLNAFSGLPYPFLKCAQNLKCLGGPNNNSACDPNTECPGGGSCTNGACVGGTNAGNPCNPHADCVNPLCPAPRSARGVALGE